MKYVLNYIASIPKRLLVLLLAFTFSLFIIPIVLFATFIQIMFLDNN